MNEEINKEALLEGLAAEHNKKCLAVAAVRTEYDQAVASLRDVYIEHLKEAVDAAAGTEAVLYNAISDSPELFEQKRTRTVGTVTYGMRKMPGKVVVADAKKSVASLRRQVEDGTVSSELVEPAIQVTYAIQKAPAAKLPGKVLQKAGIKITDDTDIVVLKDEVSGEGRKVIKSLRSDSVSKAK